VHFCLKIIPRVLENMTKRGGGSIKPQRNHYYIEYSTCTGSNEGPNKDIMLENAIYIILVIVCSDEGIWSKVDPCI
jgi:hypothetical protein